MTDSPVGVSRQNATHTCEDAADVPGGLDPDPDPTPIGLGGETYRVACPVSGIDRHAEAAHKHHIPEQIDGPKHDFLLTNSKYDLIKMGGQVGALIESLPETATTFSVTDEAYDLPSAFSHTSGAVRHKLLGLHGAWIVPNRISTRKDQYVNPNSVHAGHHSDAAVWCEYCDSVIHQHQARTSEGHADDCPPHGRWATTARLLQKRDRIIHEVAELGINGKDLAERLNLTPSALTDWTTAAEIDMRALSDTYRERRRNTVAELLIRGFDANAIADAYGVSRRRVCIDCKDVTGKTPAELQRSTDFDLAEYARF